MLTLIRRRPLVPPQVRQSMPANYVPVVLSSNASTSAGGASPSYSTGLVATSSSGGGWHWSRGMRFSRRCGVLVGRSAQEGTGLPDTGVFFCRSGGLLRGPRGVAGEGCKSA